MRNCDKACVCVCVVRTEGYIMACDEDERLVKVNVKAM